MNAEKYNLDRIYFGGCFIRGVWSRNIHSSGSKLVVDRTCGDYSNIVVCYSILEQGYKAGVVPSTRGVLVSGHL
jgi:hypothetical protein